jgi:hypothetical protein
MSGSFVARPAPHPEPVPRLASTHTPRPIRDINAWTTAGRIPVPVGHRGHADDSHSLTFGAASPHSTTYHDKSSSRCLSGAIGRPRKAVRSLA